MDAVQKAKSGHPGMPMGVAPAAVTLWTKYLRHNPGNPHWVNRDRFVLSAGHGCTLLYTLLHLTGYDLSLDEIKNFRQWGSKTPGHPEYGHTPGVEVTTGPLGQGVANAVGMAIAQKYLAAKFNRESFPIVDYRIYALAGDGCLQEGVSSEASSLAGHLALNNLILIYDDNRITIDGPTSLSFSEDVSRRYEAYGWFVQTVDGDGNDMQAFEAALQKAIEEPRRPSLIKLRTHIGFGSPNKQDSAEAHGSPLGEEEVALTKARLGWDPALSFHIPEEVLAHFRAARVKGSEAEEQWQQLFTRYANVHPALAGAFTRARDGMMPPDWDRLWSDRVPVFQSGTQMATREAQGKILDAIMPELPLVVGGSADLTPSNNTRFKGVEDFTAEHRTGRYIRYGVREHGMGAIMNGISVSGFVRPYGATFFVFSDYMRPAVRLAALSRYPVIYSYTHDSIGLGEDGPTHQAVEHLASFRAMPGMVVLRPADANETAVAWRFALEHREGPVMLALTRQKLPVLDRTVCAPAENLRKGAYTLTGAPDPRVLLLAAGSEVHLALEAMKELDRDGIASRVVSMPSWELFERQPPEYREQVLPSSVRARVAVEAGVRQGWDRYIGPGGEFIGMHTFGASAPYQKAYEGFGITVSHIVESAKGVL
jgi:transketolase